MMHLLIVANANDKQTTNTLFSRVKRISVAMLFLDSRELAKYPFLNPTF